MTTFLSVTKGATVFRDINNASLSVSTAENNATCRFNFEIDNDGGVYKNQFAVGDEITVKAEMDVNPPTSAIFVGLVTEVKYKGKLGNKDRIQIMCRDYGALLQRNTMEPEVYTNQEVSVIINDLFDKYAPSSLTRTGVQTTAVTLSRMAFNQTTLFDAFKQLADLAGYYFYVDTSKDLVFAPKSTTSSGITLNNTNVYKADIRQDIDSVKNRIYVYGDKVLVAAPQESFTSDGAGSVFTLGNKPSNTEVTVGGTIQKGGLYNLNVSTTSGPDYLVNYHDKEIIFVSGATVGYDSLPSSGTSFTVDYKRAIPIIKFAEDPTSINNYGERTEVLIDKNISDPLTARDIAKNQIKLRKDPALDARISVRGILSITPGQTLVLDLPNQNVSSQTYEILEASYDFTKQNMLSDSVLKVRLSKRITDVTDILKDLILKVKQLQAGDVDPTAVITRLFAGTGSMGLKVSDWKVKAREVHDSFILAGAGSNGFLGSPATGFSGGQVVLGSGTVGPFTIQQSGP